ncbi:hypothetical protein M378DRAFT_155601 [Amanita muscaria Koide BX008]|uniref:Uncharacterized protein n=1 Tax=Amanita muscaria (strain Koide BX008) TaxID=946122 RepID=A0A0C2XND5_AMAMK|nr:hypothetical protein M378DRAFT_155601 [Amanita muscaria Koide BX008]
MIDAYEQWDRDVMTKICSERTRAVRQSWNEERSEAQEIWRLPFDTSTPAMTIRDWYTLHSEPQENVGHVLAISTE